MEIKILYTLHNPSQGKLDFKKCFTEADFADVFPDIYSIVVQTFNRFPCKITLASTSPSLDFSSTFEVFYQES